MWLIYYGVACKRLDRNYIGIDNNLEYIKISMERLMHCRSKRVFSHWLATFRTSINGYGYYTDFAKVYNNAARLKIEINILNALVGSGNIERDFENILQKYPECLQAIPILLAVREKEIYCQDENGAIKYVFNHAAQTIEQYKYFMRETGLFDMLQNHIIGNLYDYVTGVEAGLGSNGRKNRGGHQMEDLVESYLSKAGVEYYKEMYLAKLKGNGALILVLFRQMHCDKTLGFCGEYSRVYLCY